MANKSPKSLSDVVDDNWDVLVTSSELIPGRLYFVVLRTPYKPHYTQNVHFFSIDDELKYIPFLEDFGPLNLALLYRYCYKLNLKLKSSSLQNKKIVHYTTLRPKKRVNAAFLAGAYAIIYLDMHPNEVYNKLNKKEAPPFRDFRDASNGCALYEISLLDCLNAIYQAHKHNFFNFDDFNVNEYEYYETVQNGDLNWIVPNKFLAFAGPQSRNYLSSVKGRVIDPLVRTPESYVKYFRDNNVTTIVRLNNKLYDASKFTKEGFTHVDLFFIDGSTPSDDLVQKFLTVSESTNGAVAVHCKAGLGRTGSMIACYIMKWYKFSAREAIAWLRICRPASIIGHQQEWLEMKQAEMWALHSKITTPRHNCGIYNYKSKVLPKKKLGGALKPAKAAKALPIDNVSRIANKVDSMSIETHEKDENKNQEISLNRICGRMSNLQNQHKDENKNDDIILRKDSSNVENFSFRSCLMEQGDMLNEIKAKRLTRGNGSKTNRKTWNTNAINGMKRVIVVDKLNSNHPRRPLTRSKSSQNPPPKTVMNETTRINVGSAPTVPASLNMTLRSNRLYSLRQKSKLHTSVTEGSDSIPAMGRLGKTVLEKYTSKRDGWRRNKRQHQVVEASHSDLT
ncbi:hypothetical protein RUM44_006554 [Polyplax serrata]|uniref:protein-tyrosine-phosphatase n=1 Tax=Polyplax serrata TaxID=468196 RepID=A0ABR1AIG7_POLSC